MATGLHSDLVIRDELITAGFIEGIGQNINAFNAASGGAIVLRSDYHEGDYIKQRFFDQIASSTVSRRDLTSEAAATGVKVTMDEKVGVKLFRKVGPFDFTEGSLRTANINMDEFAFQLGRQIAARVQQEMLNKGLLAVATALAATAGVFTDNVATGGLTWTLLNTSLGKFGDARSMIRSIVMHSASLTTLVGDSIANYKIENVAGATIINGETRVGMGRNIVETDSTGLVNADGVTTGTDSNYTLGLVPNAVVITLSEGLLTRQYYLDRDQVTRRLHPEFAFTVEVKGFAYDTSAGNNPTDGAVGTAANWDAVVADDKDKAGIAIETDES